MDRKDIIHMAREAEFEESEIASMGDNFIRFANLIASNYQTKIDTLYDMYKQASRQRDELMYARGEK